MRFIKLILMSFIALFAVLLFFSILMPSTVIVSRAVDISAPVDSIKGYVADLNQWVYWMKGMRSKEVKIYSPKEALLGNQKVQITSITDSSVVASWKSPALAAQESTIRLIHTANSSQTIVQWQFVQKLHWYPWEKFGSFMNDKILGPLMEQNLQALKQLCEHRQVNLEIPFETN